MKQMRPKNLNLFTIQFPLPAIVSILHRISGIVLFLAIPFILWLWSCSLTESGFDTLQRWVQVFYIKFFLWAFLIPFCVHLIAGIRHLLSDIHIGDSLASGRRSAQLAIIISLIVILLAGIWLW